MIGYNFKKGLTKNIIVSLSNKSDTGTIKNDPIC